MKSSETIGTEFLNINLMFTDREIVVEKFTFQRLNDQKNFVID